MPSELRQRHSTREIDDATRAWAILVEGVGFAPLAYKIFQAGSPGGGWKVVEDWFEPKRGCPTRFVTRKFENLHMQKAEDPLVWCDRVDDAGNMLACFDVHKTEVVLRRHFVRHLTDDYDTECCALLRRRDLPRNELEEILRDRLAEMQVEKPARRQNALFAGAQGCGGQGMVAAAEAIGIGVAAVVPAEGGALQREHQP